MVDKKLNKIHYDGDGCDAPHGRRTPLEAHGRECDGKHEIGSPCNHMLYGLP